MDGGSWESQNMLGIILWGPQIPILHENLSCSCWGYHAQLASLSLGLTASGSTVESHDCAQPLALEEHHSTCQHLSLPNRSSQTWFYNISEVQSNFYISSHRGETPEGTSVTGTPPLSHHPSPSGRRCHLIALPSLPSSSSFHLTLALVQTLIRTGSCRFSADVASFLPHYHKAAAS